MRYDFAPMEGVTDRYYRQLHHKWFGSPAAPSRYYAPFISPPENRVFIPKKMADILPENNPHITLIPQLLCRDAALTVWMVGQLRALGYTEVNLNFGCPSGTVTAKGKGAGMLRDPAALDRFLYEVFAGCGGPISVKTRLGVALAAEFGAILEVYNRYPLCEVILHPRVMKQQYRGQADLAAFAAYAPLCRAPLVYNGDLTTPGQFARMEAAYPGLAGLMAGRGLLADPALLRRARGGAPATRQQLRGFTQELYEAYSVAFGGKASAVNRMKALWAGLAQRFAGSEAFARQLARARDPWAYEVAADQMLSLLPLREEAGQG